MNQPNRARKRVVVIGGGITGLAAAHRLTELDPTIELVLLEAGNRLGGVIETVRRDGFLVERSADNFITSVPWAADLCQRVGLADELIPTSSQQRNAMVVCRGQLERVPLGFMLMAPARLGAVLATPILSGPGKLRLLAEYFIPRRKEAGDETVASFAERRLGREAFERIVQPLVGGIYTADPRKLSLEATLPRFIEMEQKYGGLIRGARRTAGATGDEAAGESGARYGLFVTPRAGLSSLVSAIASRLPEGSVRLESPVERVTRDAAGLWSLELAAQAGNERLECEGLIVAVAAPAAGRMLRSVDAALAADLAGIEYASTSIVTLAYRREQIGQPLDSFGFVVPMIENRKILAASFSSVKFPGRAPEGTLLVRVFIGGACQAELAGLDDDTLKKIAGEELQSLMQVKGAPLFADVVRWTNSMPQYHLGHLSRVARIESAAANWSGLALAGNAYHGVGIPHCVHSGELAAEHIAATLKTS